MRSWARFNFYAYERPFMHCLYFICERKFYASSQVKITRQIHPNTDTSLCPFGVRIREVWLYMLGTCKAKAWCKHPHKWMKNSNLPIKISILEKKNPSIACEQNFKTWTNHKPVHETANSFPMKKRLTSFDVGYVRQRTDELNLVIKICFDYNKTMKIYFRNGITKSAMIFFLAMSYISENSLGTISALANIALLFGNKQT